MKTPMQEHIEWLKKEYKKLESMGELGIALHIGDCIQNAESLLEKETVIKELHEALTNLLQAADDEGWINDETGEDWEEQKQARKALANTPSEYLR